MELLRRVMRYDRPLTDYELTTRIVLTFGLFAASSICGLFVDKLLGRICLSYGVGFALMTALRLLFGVKEDE